MTQKDLNILKEKLPKNFATSLGKTCNVNADTVRKVFNKRHENQKIIDEAITLAQEWQAHLKKQSELINAL